MNVLYIDQGNKKEKLQMKTKTHYAASKK